MTTSASMKMRTKKVDEFVRARVNLVLRLRDLVVAVRSKLLV